MEKEQEEAEGSFSSRQIFCADLTHPYLREAHHKDTVGDEI